MVSYRNAGGSRLCMHFSLKILRNVCLAMQCLVLLLLTCWNLLQIAVLGQVKVQSKGPYKTSSLTLIEAILQGWQEGNPHLPIV